MAPASRGSLAPGGSAAAGHLLGHLAVGRLRPPFTPVIETVRGLLVGTATGDSAALAVAWCAGITLVGYLWSKKLYNRDPIR